MHEHIRFGSVFALCTILVHKKRVALLKFYAHGWWVIHFAREISQLLVHYINTGKSLEYIAGTWFGIPLFATSLGTILVGALACTEKHTEDACRIQSLAALLCTFAMWYWFNCCYESKNMKTDDLSGGIMKAYLCVFHTHPSNMNIAFQLML